MADPPATATMDDAELRSVAILGEALLRIESARAYGLIEGGPTVNVDRVESTIAAARERGLEWTDDEVRGAATAFVSDFNAA